MTATVVPPTVIDSRAREALLEYAKRIGMDPHGPCTLCRIGKREFLCFDPEVDAAEYLCRDCFGVYVRGLEQQQKKKETL